MTFSISSLALIQGRLTVRMKFILFFFFFKNCASELAPCLVKLFFLCFSTSINPSCWKFAHIQPVPKKSDHSNPSNYHPIDLIACLSKAFESVLNKKTLRHLSAHNILFSMVSGKADRLMIFLFLKLNLGHHLLGTSVKPLLSALTYRNLSKESGINL